MSEYDYVLVNFHWDEPGDDTGHFMMHWRPLGTPLPRVGEHVQIPHDDYVHKVIRVEFTISPPRDTSLELYSTVSIIDIETVRTFRRTDGKPFDA